MAFAFKVWDQANDGGTMAIRAKNVREIARLANVCTGPSSDGAWPDLATYLTAAKQATKPPKPYRRAVDTLWLDGAIAVPLPYCPTRGFEVTYTGVVRKGGGFSSQAYCIIDPKWNASLRPHKNRPITVEWYRGKARDLIVVGP